MCPGNHQRSQGPEVGGHAGRGPRGQGRAGQAAGHRPLSRGLRHHPGRVRARVGQVLTPIHAAESSTPRLTVAVAPDAPSEGGGLGWGAWPSGITQRRVGMDPLGAGVAVADVTGAVAAMAAEGKARGTIQKSLNAVRMPLDHAGRGDGPACGPAQALGDPGHLLARRARPARGRPGGLPLAPSPVRSPVGPGRGRMCPFAGQVRILTRHSPLGAKRFSHNHGVGGGRDDLGCAGRPPGPPKA